MTHTTGTARGATVLLRREKSRELIEPWMQPSESGEQRSPFPIVLVGRKRYLDPEHPVGTEERFQQFLRESRDVLSDDSFGLTVSLSGFEIDALRISHSPSAARKQVKQPSLLSLLHRMPSLGFAHTQYSEECGVGPDAPVQLQYEIASRASELARLRRVPLATVSRSALHTLEDTLGYLQESGVAAVAIQRPIRRNPVLAPDLRMLEANKQYIFGMAHGRTIPVLLYDQILSSILAQFVSGDSGRAAADKLEQRALVLQDANQPFAVSSFQLDKLGRHPRAAYEFKAFIDALNNKSTVSLQPFSSNLVDTLPEKQELCYSLQAETALSLPNREDTDLAYCSRSALSTMPLHQQVIGLVARDRGFAKAAAYLANSSRDSDLTSMVEKDCVRQVAVHKALRTSLEERVPLTKYSRLERNEAVREQLRGLARIAQLYQ